mmetsp:Transcript_6841/g.14659  ORF Transcript_6841/g.14659 Transcript_6841/m.14659 type:complete len:929 (-) Transcript_6841:553-3339(-)
MVKHSEVADLVADKISKWERVPELGGGVVTREQWNGAEGSWAVGVYDPQTTFETLHEFLEKQPRARYVVVGQQFDKDPGVHAMEHPGTYVATLEVVVDGRELTADDRFYEILEEARDYNGPVVLIAILHERPFLYRYNPSAEQAFTPDSGTMTSIIESFLQREEQLVLFVKKEKEMAGEGAEGAAGALAAGLGSASEGEVTVLYASDTGHAEECARKMSRIIKLAGRPVQMKTMNSAKDAPLQGLMLFVTSTAGKGEFPANGTGFWENLESRKENVEGLTFSTLSLGDSKYWPEPEHFAAAGRRLHQKLVDLGGTPLLDIAISDEQDADGYRTGFSAWEKELRKAMSLKAGDDAGAAADEAPHKTPEQAKYDSNYLRGTLSTSLRDRTTGGIPQPDQVVIKHHGIYQQDDRDMRAERQALGLENAFSFMIRVRQTAGDGNAAQWRAIDEIASTLGKPNLKITTRQTWQLQGIQKHNLIESVRMIQRACMDSIAACGDVARMVCCTSNPMATTPALMDECVHYTKEIHDHCLPKTRAWHEIFILDDAVPNKKYKVGGSTPFEEEPLYGRTYLPRKFKMAVAIPPYNDVDIYTHDVGFIAIIENNQLKGFNVIIGGGLGYTHNNRATFPRLGSMLGFIEKDKAKYVAEMVIAVQRDHGCRSDRKHARLKYTVHDHGIDWYRAQVEDLLGAKFEPARPFEFTERSDPVGWMENAAGHHLGIYIEEGRVAGREKEGLRKLADRDICKFRMTCNQGLILTHIKTEDKAVVESIMEEHGIRYKRDERVSGLRSASNACSALPLCPLAFSEAERYLPDLVSLLEAEARRYGLFDEQISIRMTGCPNSCGRPEMAEIGLVGRAPGSYNLYLGGDHLGTRANRIYKEGLEEAQIIEEVSPLLGKYAANREPGERFGNFLVRSGVVKPNNYGPDFHDF